MFKYSVIINTRSMISSQENKETMVETLSLHIFLLVSFLYMHPRLKLILLDGDPTLQEILHHIQNKPFLKKIK